MPQLYHSSSLPIEDLSTMPNGTLSVSSAVKPWSFESIYQRFLNPDLAASLQFYVAKRNETKMNRSTLNRRDLMKTSAIALGGAIIGDAVNAYPRSVNT